MLEPFDTSRFVTALEGPRGWVELGTVLACIGLAWLFDRALGKRAAATESRNHGRLHAGFVRVVFPLTALLLLVAARFAFRHAGWRPVFIDVAMPLLVALAAIRMAVYAMRKLFAFAPEQYAGRNGGYTRITKLGPRLGDGAEVVVLELL